MKGSFYLVDFPSEKELQEWLDVEPYMVGKVWQESLFINQIPEIYGSLAEIKSGLRKELRTNKGVPHFLYDGEFFNKYVDVSNLFSCQ